MQYCVAVRESAGGVVSSVQIEQGVKRDEGGGIPPDFQLELTALL